MKCIQSVQQQEQLPDQIREIEQVLIVSPKNQSLNSAERTNKTLIKFNRSILQNAYLPKFRLSSNPSFISIAYFHRIATHDNIVNLDEGTQSKLKSSARIHNTKQPLTYPKKKGIRQFTTCLKITDDKPQPTKSNQAYTVCKNPFPVDKILNYFQIKLMAPFPEGTKPNFSFGVANDGNFPLNKKNSINISFELTEGTLEIFRNSIKIEEIENFEYKTGDVMGCGLIYHRNQVILTFNGKMVLYKFKLNVIQQKQQKLKKATKSINDAIKENRHLYYPFIVFNLQKISLEVIFENSSCNFCFSYTQYIQYLQNKLVESQMNRQANIGDQSIYGLVLNYFKYYGFDKTGQMLQSEMKKRSMTFSSDTKPILNKFDYEKVSQEMNSSLEDNIEEQIVEDIMDNDNQYEEWENPSFDFGQFSVMNFANIFGARLQNKMKEEASEEKKESNMKKNEENPKKDNKRAQNIENMHKANEEKFRNVRIQIIKDIKKGKLQQAFKQMQKSYKRITKKQDYLESFFKAHIILKLYNDEGFSKALDYTKKQHKCLTEFENYLFPFFNPKSLENNFESSVIFRPLREILFLICPESRGEFSLEKQFDIFAQFINKIICERSGFMSNSKLELALSHYNLVEEKVSEYEIPIGGIDLDGINFQ